MKDSTLERIYEGVESLGYFLERRLETNKTNSPTFVRFVMLPSRRISALEMSG